MKYPQIATLIVAWTCAASGLPVITHVTEPACHGEAIVVTGEWGEASTLQVKALYLGASTSSFDHREPEDPATLTEGVDRRPALPGTPPEDALDCRVLGTGERYLHAVMQCSRLPWTRVPVTTALWVGDGSGWSKPFVVNRPRAQWLSPRVQEPGEVVRIFGRTFAWTYQLPPAQVFIRRAGGRELAPLRQAHDHREDGHTERWCLAAWLPEEIAPGEYELFVHGRHGGQHGWSEPLGLTVASAKPTVGPRVNVRDLGAKGDGLTDDTEALEQALDQAAGGGTVLLPPGAYAVSRTVEIPEHVSIRGAGMHASTICNLERPALHPQSATGAPRPLGPALLHGMGHFTLQDLTVRFTPATGNVLAIGRDLTFVEDVTLLRVRLESRQDYGLAKTHPYTSRPLSTFSCRLLRMIRCETYGPGGVLCARKMEDCRFSQNRFVTDRRWRGLAFKFWGAERCIFEDNVMSGDTRGFVMQTSFGVNYRNFIAGNTVERTVLGGNAGETYLVEGAGYLYESRVAGAGAGTVTTERWATVRGRPAEAEHVVERFVVVARGRGFGQWRRIVAAEPSTRTLEVDRAWLVPPDASSTVVVMNGLIETVFVNNQEVDSGKGLYLYYAGAINNIVDRHICDRSLGVVLMTRDDRQEPESSKHDTSPDLFNLIRECRIHDGGGIVVGAGGRMPLEDDAHLPAACFGNRVIGNEILRTKPFSGAQYGSTWRWGGGWSHLMAGISIIPMDLGKSPGTGLDGPPRILGNVCQDNWVGETRFGIGISKRAANTVLLQNVTQWVPNPLVDKGQGTVVLESDDRADEAYTPERGPIR